MPAVKSLSHTWTADNPVDFFLNIAHKSDYQSTEEHPLGNVMINEKMFDMLKLLLLHQPYIKTIEKYDTQNVDIDLDIFRYAHHARQR